MVNQRPFYEHRSVLPVHSPPCAVLDKVECDLCQYLSGEEKYSQLFECFGRDAFYRIYFFTIKSPKAQGGRENEARFF